MAPGYRTNEKPDTFQYRVGANRIRPKEDRVAEQHAAPSNPALRELCPPLFGDFRSPLCRSVFRVRPPQEDERENRHVNIIA
jgi:hypothetical protein